MWDFSSWLLWMSLVIASYGFSELMIVWLCLQTWIARDMFEFSDPRNRLGNCLDCFRATSVCSLSPIHTSFLYFCSFVRTFCTRRPDGRVGREAPSDGGCLSVITASGTGLGVELLVAVCRWKLAALLDSGRLTDYIIGEAPIVCYMTVETRLELCGCRFDRSGCTMALSPSVEEHEIRIIWARAPVCRFKTLNSRSYLLWHKLDFLDQ